MANKGLFREYDALAYNKDSLAGPGDRDRAVNHVKKGKKGAEVVFNPQDHKEFLTGFRKRKLQRRKAAHKQLEVKAKQQRIEERAERRTKLKQELGLPDDYGVGSSSSEDEPEVDIQEDERAQVTVYNDGPVTTRVSVVDLAVPGADSDADANEAGSSGQERSKQNGLGRQSAPQHAQPRKQQQHKQQHGKPAHSMGKQAGKKGHAARNVLSGKKHATGHTQAGKTSIRKGKVKKKNG